MACAPILAAARGRALFEAWPSRSVAANYALVSLGVAVAHVLTFLGVVAALDGLEDMAAVWWAVRVNFGFPLLASATAAVTLPRTGRWTPTGSGLDGRLVLALGALWYGVASTAAIALVLFVLTFWFYPG